MGCTTVQDGGWSQVIYLFQWTPLRKRRLWLVTPRVPRLLSTGWSYSICSILYTMCQMASLKSATWVENRIRTFSFAQHSGLSAPHDSPVECFLSRRAIVPHHGNGSSTLGRACPEPNLGSVHLGIIYKINSNHRFSVEIFHRGMLFFSTESRLRSLLSLCNCDKWRRFCFSFFLSLYSPDGIYLWTSMYQYCF